MQFTFEESELINNFFLESTELLTKENIIERLNNAKSNTEDPELSLIAESTINKIKKLDDNSIKILISSLPVDMYFSI